MAIHCFAKYVVSIRSACAGTQNLHLAMTGVATWTVARGLHERRRGAPPARRRMSIEARHDELKRFVRFTPDDAARIARFGPRVTPHFARIASELYDRVREHADAHAVLTDEEQIDLVQRATVEWLERLFGGVYDDAYFERTARAGTRQIAVGLPQRYVPVALAVLRSLLFSAIAQDGGEDERAAQDSLSRLLDVELAVMLDAHHANMLARLDRASSRHHATDGTFATCGSYVLEDVPLAVVALDDAGTVRVFNRAAEKLTGYAEDEAIGASFADLVLPEGTPLRSWTKGGGTPVDGLVEVLETRHRAGQRRETLWRVARLGSDEQHLTFAFGTDVTDEVLERKRIEDARRLASLGTLVAGLAHELRNPLNGARLSLSYLSRNLKDAPDDVVEAVAATRHETQRLARLLTEFLEYARPQPLRREPVSIIAVIARIVELLRPLAESTHAELRTDLPLGELVVHGDRERLEQVVLSLVTNSLEALPSEGGTVVLRARREPMFVRVEIEDDGRGFDGDAPIYDPFYTTKVKGTGLGLALAHRIVTDHGGLIDATTRPGSTRFRIRIPTLSGAAS